jgi:hypothetical protein
VLSCWALHLFSVQHLELPQREQSLLPQVDWEVVSLAEVVLFSPVPLRLLALVVVVLGVLVLVVLEVLGVDS